MVTDIYSHPVVQGLRRQLAASERRREQLEHVLQESLTRDLQTRTLEALNPRAPGMLAPAPGGLITIHVDARRLRANRVQNRRDPVIRLIDRDDVWHCHALRLHGPSWMAEDYDRPVTGRPAAVCVLQTADPVEVLR